MHVLIHFFVAVLILEMTDGERSSKDSDYDEEDTAPSTSSQSEQSRNGDSVPKSKGSQSQQGASSRKVRAEARWPKDKMHVTKISADGMPFLRIKS